MALALCLGVSIEWPRYDYRKVESPVEALGKGIGRYLGGRIRRLRLARVAFVDRHVLRGAVHLARRSHYDAPHGLAARCLKHIESPANVGVDIAVGSLIAIGNGYQRRKMKHGVDSTA